MLMGKNKSKKLKEDRENSKGWADGGREELVLLPSLDTFIAARQRGYVSERRATADICNMFHTFFPYWLKDHEEYEGPRLPYDRNQIFDPCAGVPESDKPSVCAHIKWLNDRIHRWLKYRADVVLTAPHISLNNRKNPLVNLLLQLSGFSNPPRRRSAVQQYQRENHDALQPVYAAAWAEDQLKGTRAAKAVQDAHWRDAVVLREFKKLDKAEQDAYLARAIAEGNIARSEYNRLKNEGPSVSPESRQKAITHLPAFAGNLLRGIQAYTGLQATLLIGGPIPSAQGELCTYSVFAGKNQAGQTWAEADEEGLSQVKATYQKYIATVYTPEECAAAALEVLTADDLDLNGLIPMPHLPTSDDDSASEDESAAGSDSDDEPLPNPKRKRSRPQTKADVKVAASKKNTPSGSQSKVSVSQAKAKAKTQAPSTSTTSKAKPSAAATTSKAKSPSATTTSKRKPPAAASPSAASVAKVVSKPQGGFDVRNPAATYNSGDPPGETEGYRRLEWEREKHNDFVRYMPNIDKMTLMLEWANNHYVDDTGRVRDRRSDIVDAADDATDSDSDYVEGKEDASMKEVRKRKDDRARRRGKKSTAGPKSADKTTADVIVENNLPTTSSASSPSTQQQPPAPPTPSEPFKNDLPIAPSSTSSTSGSSPSLSSESSSPSASSVPPPTMSRVALSSTFKTSAHSATPPALAVTSAISGPAVPDALAARTLPTALPLPPSSTLAPSSAMPPPSATVRDGLAAIRAAAARVPSRRAPPPPPGPQLSFSAPGPQLKPTQLKPPPPSLPGLTQEELDEEDDDPMADKDDDDEMEPAEEGDKEPASAQELSTAPAEPAPLRGSRKRSATSLKRPAASSHRKRPPPPSQLTLTREEMEEEEDDPEAAIDEDESPASASASAHLNDIDMDVGDLPICPVSAAFWFRNIFDVINRSDLGEAYCRLLGAWIKLESKHDFDINKGATLTVSGAPPQAGGINGVD
ncbi:hypothetical protein BD626DRAFT_573961 [Schizophyllum amplum]|uniref:Uncharacterized protein n=1 Tax=Schizophyllum amplum TaxID=97359 RepID=A0A550BZM6_9AGAR|nr:hypothetical protein BD626DRAFT_573961 [Auriculariopsis ampla]